MASISCVRAELYSSRQRPKARSNSCGARWATVGDEVIWLTHPDRFPASHRAENLIENALHREMRRNHQLRPVDDVMDLLLQRGVRLRQVQDVGDVRRQGELRFSKPDGM